MSDIIDEMGEYPGDGSEVKLPPQVKGKLEYHSNPAPSNLEAELDKLIEQLTEEASLHMLNMKLAPELTSELVQNAEARAKSQLKQLILKDVLEMIGEDWEIDKRIMSKATVQLREDVNSEKRQLRQSARKRYQ